MYAEGGYVQISDLPDRSVSVFLRRCRRVGAGASVPPVLLRGEPGAQVAEPGLPLRPLPAAVRIRHGAAVHPLGAGPSAVRLVFGHVLVLPGHVRRHGAGYDAAGVYRRRRELQGLPPAPVGLQQALGQCPGHHLPAVHVLLGRVVAGVLLFIVSAAAEAGGVVRGAPAGVVYGGRLLRHFPH